MSKPRWHAPWIALGPLLIASTVAHCSGAVHENAVDSGTAEDAPVEQREAAASDSSPPGNPADAKSVIQGVGSKCLTVCPMHLTCDPYKWKGFCTKSCTADSDCQGTGDPPVVGVCGSDNLCYKACDPMTNPCTRDQWTCVGPPGHTYCDNFYDAHYYKPETGGSSSGGEGGVSGESGTD
jgi:hypothetical protein